MDYKTNKLYPKIHFSKGCWIKKESPMDNEDVVYRNTCKSSKVILDGKCIA